MKKEKYGIEITKPWSKEMYNHNDNLLKEFVEEIKAKWTVAYQESEEACYAEDGLSEDNRETDFMQETYEHWANATMKDIQEAVLCYQIGGGIIEDIQDDVMQEVEVMPYWRAKEVAEDLSIKLSKEFIGLK